MKALYNDGSVAEVESAEEALHIIRHSAAHIMAQAIKRLYPEADFAYRQRLLLRRRPRR